MSEQPIPQAVSLPAPFTSREDWWLALDMYKAWNKDPLLRELTRDQSISTQTLENKLIRAGHEHLLWHGSKYVQKHEDKNATRLEDGCKPIQSMLQAMVKWRQKPVFKEFTPYDLDMALQVQRFWKSKALLRGKTPDDLEWARRRAAYKKTAPIISAYTIADLEQAFKKVAAWEKLPEAKRDPGFRRSIEYRLKEAWDKEPLFKGLSVADLLTAINMAALWDQEPLRGKTLKNLNDYVRLAKAWESSSHGTAETIKYMKDAWQVDFEWTHSFKSARVEEVYQYVLIARAWKDTLELLPKSAHQIARGVTGILQNGDAELDLSFYESVWIGIRYKLGESAAYFFGDLYNAVSNPVETATGIVRVLAGYGLEIVGIESEYRQYSDQVTKFFVDRYGSWAAAKETIAKDPFGVLSELSTFLVGAGGAIRAGSVLAIQAAKVASRSAAISRYAKIAARLSKRSGQAMSKTGDYVSKAGEVINPLFVPGYAAAYGLKTLSPGGAQTHGQTAGVAISRMNKGLGVGKDAALANEAAKRNSADE